MAHGILGEFMSAVPGSLPPEVLVVTAVDGRVSGLVVLAVERVVPVNITEIKLNK